MRDSTADSLLALGLDATVVAELRRAVEPGWELVCLPADAEPTPAMGDAVVTRVGSDASAQAARLRARWGTRPLLLLANAPTAEVLAAARAGGPADWLATERIAADALPRLEALRAMARAERETAAVAGGLAHDLNSLLGGLMGATALLPAAATTDPAIRALVARVDAASARGAGLVAALTAYTTPPVEAEPMSARVAAQAAIDAVRGGLPAGVEAMLDESTDGGTAFAEPDLQTLAQNLLLAGAGQLPRGGTLRLGVTRSPELGTALEVVGVPTVSSGGGLRDANPMRAGLATRPAGLGWALAELVVARGGGQLTFSRETSGWRMRAEIAPPAVPPTLAAAAQEEVAGGVLLVAPDDVERAILRDMLALAGVAGVHEATFAAVSGIAGESAGGVRALVCLEPTDPELPSVLAALRGGSVRHVALLSQTAPPAELGIDGWASRPPRPDGLRRALTAAAG